MYRLTMLLLTVLTALSLACGSVAAAPVVADTAESVVSTVAVHNLPRSAEASRTRDENAPAFSGVAAKQHVDALSVQIGSRQAGSNVQTQTHQYLESQFQAMGYETELQPFPITSYQDRGSSLTLTSGTSQDVIANTLQYSGPGVVEAQLVEAGLGRPADFDAVSAAGKIALVTRGEIRFVDKVKAAESAGAVAVIIVNNQPGNFNGSLIGMSTIPTVGVAQEDGATLRQAARDGGTVRVAVDASIQESTGVNVIATRAGGPQTLVIGGHIDSVAAGPGANDNASGTAVVLELARVLAQRETQYTLKFIGFDAEEIGLVGSNYYVNQLSEQERRAIRAMINLDMVGVGTESRVGGTASLIDLAQAAGEQSGLRLGEMGESGASDHASFIRAGIPALFVYRSNDPNYHSPNDRAEFVDPANLEIAGQLVLDVVDALERGE
ncbi:MAG: M20/M25/M40 family metallo-hydrolase [Chloroflexota bacterium]